jgi:crossover junction endodeoxyribonuclease RuvC
MARILGIDPGLQLTGYGCIDCPASTDQPQLVEGGVIRLNRRDDLAVRLDVLHRELTSVITELRPDHIVVESLFSHYQRPQTAILMGHARGVILLACRSIGISPTELTATEVKRSLTGHGHAAKDQVQGSVTTLLSLAAPPSPVDISDALALAICRGHRLTAEALSSPLTS